jgi:outer membrane protein assembly factor BamA
MYTSKKENPILFGFIGFSNNETNKIRLNGYADIKLENILGSGELLSIYWKSDGNDQKTFNTNIELPYLLKSQLGLKAQIQLFRYTFRIQKSY